MAKTLVIAEKPSVGQDLARVLPGPFEKHTGAGEKTARWLEGPEHVITWAVGHLVQLAEPDEYDDKFKKWRMADLPIVPRSFKLVVRDERSEKQMKVVRDQLRRDDVDHVINACDAGREGELIFTYIYEYVKADKPVQRLWLNSMTNDAMREAFGHLRDGADLGALRDAAKSRSEADWIVGMNATRAATIRLRSSFDGAVSLGRVQTPTLAIIARREEEIRAFKPEKYWLVDAAFEADGARRYEGRFHAGAQPRMASAQEAQAIVDAVRGRRGEITKLEKTKRKERPPLLYDLTSLQREANTRYGFSARRTLAAAQRCYEEHKALTYPRTSSRYLTSDMVPDLKSIAGHVGRRPEYREGARYVQSLDLLPLARVVDNAKVGDHHAIIPTNSDHVLEKMSDDDRRVYDLVARRFLAVFHPDAEFENTRVETTVETHIFRTRGKVLLVPGWRGVYGELPEGEGSASDEDEGRDQQLPRLERGEAVDTRDVESLEKETKPPRRYSDASLLAAMETAGKLVDDDELREAMKESGIGTPATRAAIIERLIDVGYVERDGRALVATEKGINVVRLLDGHPLTSPALTGDWEHRLAAIEEGDERREKFMEDIAKFAGETVGVLDTTLKDVRIPRANLGPCPVCGNDIVENRKGFSCWSREDPGCGFVIWKSKAGKQLPVVTARELIAQGFTARPVTGFKGRSGRSFRAKLALEQSEDEGRWRVEFDEPWAKEGAKPPEAEVEAGADESTGARRRRSALPAAAAVGLCLALALPGAAAADKAGSVTASGGATQATLSWQAADFGVKDPRLTVVRGGATLFDGSPIADAEICSVGCLYQASKDYTPLHVADLGGDAEPEVVVDSYTGGAHCCIVSDVLYLTGAAYARAEHNWGSYGYGLKDLNGDGRLELNGYDAAFEDAFTSHVASFEPPLVLAFDPTATGALRDVTRSYPAVIRKNVKEALHIVAVTRRQHAETLGGVATYVADLYLLGRGREARPYLARARKRGDLRTAFSKAPRSFERKLLAFLHKHGYR